MICKCANVECADVPICKWLRAHGCTNMPNVTTYTCLLNNLNSENSVLLKILIQTVYRFFNIPSPFSFFTDANFTGKE
jgi:hypothetical protein